MQLPANAADHADGLAEIHLRMTGRMRQRHEGLPAPAFGDPDVIPVSYTHLTLPTTPYV